MLCILVVGARCATFLAIYESVAWHAQGANSGCNYDGVTVPVLVCLAQPRSRDTDLASSRRYAETPPDYCILG
jgi:hypothetical protein